MSDYICAQCNERIEGGNWPIVGADNKVRHAYPCHTESVRALALADVDDLRARIATLEAALAEAERNGRLSADAVEVIKGQRDAAEQQLATERAAREKAEEERDLSRGAEWVSQSAQLRAESKLTECEAGAAAMRKALEFQDPRNAVARYDRIADEFYAETGMWPPGRSRAPEMGPDPHPFEEVSRAWRDFCNAWHERWFDAALAHPAGRALLEAHAAEVERLTTDLAALTQGYKKLAERLGGCSTECASWFGNDCDCGYVPPVDAGQFLLDDHAAALARVKAELEAAKLAATKCLRCGTGGATAREYWGLCLMCHQRRMEDTEASLVAALESARSDLAAQVILLRNAEAEARERDDKISELERECARLGRFFDVNTRVAIDGLSDAIETEKELRAQLAATELIRMAMVAAADEAKGEAARLAKRVEELERHIEQARVNHLDHCYRDQGEPCDECDHFSALAAPPPPASSNTHEAERERLEAIVLNGKTREERVDALNKWTRLITEASPPAPFCPHCGDAAHAPGLCSAVCFTGGDSAGKRCECGGETKEAK